MHLDFETLYHNIALFKKRFPELARIMQLENKSDAKAQLEKIPQDYVMLSCKKNQNASTLMIRGKYLHSKYDSVSEATTILNDPFFSQPEVKHGLVFFGLGLGYHVENFFDTHRKTAAVIIEPDVFVFLLFLASRNLDRFFSHERLTLLVGLPPIDVLNFLQAQRTESNRKLPEFFLRTAEAVQPAWYTEFKTLAQRNRARRAINANTAQKFFSRWFQNLIKNVLFLCRESVHTAEPANIYSLACLENRFKKSHAVIFAGGPSLEADLHTLKKIPLKNILVIAVDTATRAVLKSGIVPDFVVTGDPQYFNFLHLSHVPLSNIKLVAEAATFPHSVRLETEATFLFSQGLPLEEVFFKELQPPLPRGSLPVLPSGGSVATTAYSLAKFLGANEIYFSGLDLSFYGKQTHFRGSTFEEAAHKTSLRIHPAQTQLAKTIFSVDLFSAPSNNPAHTGTVLTDHRMQMYAWWFESAVASDAPNIGVYTFSQNGLQIAGVRSVPIETVKTHFTNPATQKLFKKMPLILSDETPLRFERADILRRAAALLQKAETDAATEEKLFAQRSDHNKVILTSLERFLEKLNTV